MRLFLLGTAGTGKTHTMQTMLQELRRLLTARGYPASFFQVGAPTGPAAFNLRFNATTIHRLIHHRDLRRPFGELRGEALAALQEAFNKTFLIVLDEVSMIGRQFMGRIDSRLCQAKASWNVTGESLGGVSCVCIGDPAQCEAITDQQIYDRKPHKATGSETSGPYVDLSNRGLTVYEEFDQVVVLSTVHRLQRAILDRSEPDPAVLASNERCDRFGEIMLRLRDMTITHEDYFWLCRLKRSARSATDRMFFADAPVLMEFRKTTATSEEKSCDHHNHARVRAFAKETQVPVIAFDAVHEGISHDDGLATDEADFPGLS